MASGYSSITVFWMYSLRFSNIISPEKQKQSTPLPLTCRNPIWWPLRTAPQNQSLLKLQKSAQTAKTRLSLVRKRETYHTLITLHNKTEKNLESHTLWLKIFIFSTLQILDLWPSCFISSNFLGQAEKKSKPTHNQKKALGLRISICNGLWH